MSALSTQTSSVTRTSVVPNRSHARRSRTHIIRASSIYDVTVADTKAKFLEHYPRPIPSVWSTVVSELLVQGHFSKYNRKYEYNQLSSLGFVSVFDQLFEGFPDEEEKGKIFNAFLKALGEDATRTRADAETLGAFASAANGVDGLKSNPIFASMATASAENKLLYTKYIAIGMFRMLELAKATDPKALEALASAGGVDLKKISSDLSMYKGLLSKLAAAKELQEEFLEREKRKTAERMAKKAEAA
jgi:photosystem II biogenesis protein Psp29